MCLTVRWANFILIKLLKNKIKLSQRHQNPKIHKDFWIKLLDYLKNYYKNNNHIMNAASVVTTFCTN